MDLVCDQPFTSSPMATSLSSSSTPTPTPPPSSSSSPSSTADGVGVGSSTVDVGSSNESLGRRGGSMVLESVEHVVSVVLTVIFAIVGSFAGAITGGLIGLATESGLFRGAGIGAISGAVFSIEVVESSLAIWHSHRSGIWSILFVLDTILSLLSGRLVREKIGPAVQNAVQSQMSAIDTPFQEILDIFETGGTKGMLRDAVEELPKMIITPENDSDASGERICCSVCLQDFQLGETVRNLPHCHHMFHLPCIDSWLMKHGSCPLCRRDF